MAEPAYAIDAESLTLDVDTVDFSIASASSKI